MNRILRDADVAELMGITVETLRNRFSMGAPMPPYFKRSNPRTRFYEREAVAEWLSEHRFKRWKEHFSGGQANDS